MLFSRLTQLEALYGGHSRATQDISICAKERNQLFPGLERILA